MCIVGAGAIGGLLGARLAGSGHEVCLLARGDNLAAIRANGITLVQPDGSVLISRDVKAAPDLAGFGPQDVILLATKAHQLVEIATALPALCGEATVVVPLQNGVPWWFFQRFPGPFEGRRIESLDPDGVLERHIPADRIVGSIAYPAVERDGPGIIRLVEGDRFPVGELDGQRSERATAVAGMLTGAGFTSRVLSDLRAHLWVKAWGNLALNPISALTGATLAQICGYPPTRSLARQMMTEASEIADRLGLRLRISIEQRLDGAARVGEHKTSMLQDREAGRPLETDALVGVFIELGALVQVPVPAIETVFALLSLSGSP